MVAETPSALFRKATLFRGFAEGGTRDVPANRPTIPLPRDVQCPVLVESGHPATHTISSPASGKPIVHWDPVFFGMAIDVLTLRAEAQEYRDLGASLGGTAMRQAMEEAAAALDRLADAKEAELARVNAAAADFGVSA
jgi:hypothetical protein